MIITGLEDRFDAHCSLPSVIEIPKETTRLTIHCLGVFQVYYQDNPIKPLPNGKAKSIFKYLVVHRQHPIHRDILADLFWPDTDPKLARKNCYQAIHTLRKQLQVSMPGLAHVLCENSCYLINPSLEIWVDSEAFIKTYEQGQKLEVAGRLGEAIQTYHMAESLYKGDFLAEDMYEDWPYIQRESLKLAYLDILDCLSQHYFEREAFALSITYCQKLLHKEKCSEKAYRRLMRCYMHQEQRHLALYQYHNCVEALAQELDISPMPTTTQLYKEIQQAPDQL